jgi:hypothetical protein
MNTAMNAYANHTKLVINTTNARMGRFTETMAMLDASIMINDIDRAIHIVRTVKEYINVDNDTTENKIAVELYRILNFIELKLSEPNPNKDKLRELVQSLKFN